MSRQAPSDSTCYAAAVVGRIRTRSELLDALAVACELEQGLSLQYLFTAFSLKDSLSEGGIHTQEQLRYVRMWKANILLVAAQEMLHLCQAGNLTTAAGGAVQLQRPNFPQAPGYYPTHLPWRLDRFSPDVLRRYVCYEQPSPWPNPPFACGDTVPADEQRRLAEIDPFHHLPAGLLASHAPRRTAAETIGQLYASIRDGFLAIPDVIIGDPGSQVDGELVDFPQIVMVRSRDDAVRGIDLIITQGEGTTSDRPDSHYGMFLNIYRQHAALAERDPAFDPVRPVASNPLSRLHADNTYPGWRLIDDPFTGAVNDLCSEVYQTMVLLLFRFFATSEESPGQLTTMSATFLRIMTGVLKPLGEALTRLPMGPSTPGRTAGPSFEINREIQLLPFKRSAWTYLHERLVELAARAGELARQAQDAVRDDLRNAATTLAQIAGAFGAAAP